MRTTRHPPRSVHAAFTLLEMIGVLAVMGILAAVIVPNALRTVDRAAIRAEAQTLHAVGAQAKHFFQARGWLPGTAGFSWDQDLAPFVDISQNDLVINKRQIARSFIYEPSATPRRLLILSSMHAGLALPVAADLNPMARFNSVWDTVDGQIPGGGWPGWAPWRTALNGTASEFLIIERVNLQAMYMTVVLTNNSPGTTVSYRVTPVVGRPYGDDVLPRQQPPPTLTLRPNERLDLYNVANGNGNGDYVYIASSGHKVIDYNDTKFWLPQ